jgi:hypothetical protein
MSSQQKSGILHHDNAHLDDVQGIIQGIGGAAITVRHLVLIRLFAEKQSRSTSNRQGQLVGTPAPSHAFVNHFLSLASSAAKAAESDAYRVKSPVLSPVYLQRILQAFPRLLVRRNGRLRSPATVFRKFLAASAATQAAQTKKLGQSTDCKKPLDVQLTADAIAATTVDLISRNGLHAFNTVSDSHERLSNAESPEGGNSLPHVTDVSFTSITKDDLPSIMSTRLLQSVSYASSFMSAMWVCCGHDHALL